MIKKLRRNLELIFASLLTLTFCITWLANHIDVHTYTVVNVDENGIYGDEHGSDYGIYFTKGMANAKNGDTVIGVYYDNELIKVIN